MSAAHEITISLDTLEALTVALSELARACARAIPEPQIGGQIATCFGELQKGLVDMQAHGGTAR